ncbi:MAG: site-specific integrase [Acidobacteria bacterium]|nr:site-specific integrase [Acidobacteriota bacterium]
MGGSGVVKVDPRVMGMFEGRTFSEHTRLAYRTAVGQFFAFVRGLQPHEVNAEHVQRWRDDMMKRRRMANATVNLKLSAVRTFFEYLIAAGLVETNPALKKLVAVPPVAAVPHGRVLAPFELRALLAGPDRSKPEGARDYAMMIIMARMSLRAAEVCSLRASSIRWSHARWVMRYKVKRGDELTQAVPGPVKEAVDAYLRLDRRRRETLRTNRGDPYIFQPSVNYRTLEYDKQLSPRMLYTIVVKWSDYAGIGRVTPHDFRRTVITRALDKGIPYRQVQMMSGHKDPKTVMRYDHGRENLEMVASALFDPQDD